MPYTPAPLPYNFNERNGWSITDAKGTTIADVKGPDAREEDGIKSLFR